MHIDYRYFDAYNITPRYPFGHILSYTKLSYANLEVPGIDCLSIYPTGQKSVGGPKDLWDTVANLTCSITNTGDMAEADVPQLYLSYTQTTKQPVRQLRGFERVELKPNKTSTVNFPLHRRNISYWDVEAQKWGVKRGLYSISIGASSRDLKMAEKVTIRTKQIVHSNDLNLFSSSEEFERSEEKCRRLL